MRTCKYCRKKFEAKTVLQKICMSEACKTERNREAVRAYRNKSKEKRMSLDSNSVSVAMKNKFLLGRLGV